MRAIEEAARVLDHSVLAASTDRDPAREQSYSDAMYRQGVRALIFGSSLVSISTRFFVVGPEPARIGL